MKEIKVEGYNIPIRLDRYLRETNPGLTQGIIEKALRKGQIKVNGAKVKASLRIQTGDVLTDYRYPEEEASLLPSGSQEANNEYKKNPRIKSQGPDRSKLLPQDDGARILAKKLISKYKIFKNDHFYAFNKPGGLATQGGSKISLSLDDAFKILDLRLVHRLDKETSGIILAAKTRDDAVILTKAFEEHTIHKTYLACISPILEEESGSIKSYIRKKDIYIMESFKKKAPGTVEVITHYEVLTQKYGCSLVEFKPVTGRMHQLRVHSKELGSPIVGDKKYKGKADANLMLHASEVKLDKSLYGKEITIKCDLPKYFLIKI